LSAACGAGGKARQPAGDAKAIKIGVNAEMTGLVSSFGVSSTNAMKLAAKQINAKGGALGKQLQLIFADNKSEPSEAALATTKLAAQDKVVAILGPLISSTTLASTKIAQDSKIPLLTPSATNPAVTVQNGKTLDYVFRGCFIDDFMGGIMADFAANSLKAKTAALYIDSSSDLSKSTADIFEASFVKGGGKIVAREAYLSRDTDFKSALTKLKASSPDVVFVPGNYQEAAMIVKQARELDLAQPIVGVDAWDSPKLFEIGGAKALNNTYYPGHYSPDDSSPEVQQFVKDYQAEYGAVPDTQAVLGYDSVFMLFDAIKRAGSESPEKIKDALAATKNLRLVSGVITLDSSHNPIKGAVINENKDGKVTFKERIDPKP
jgi:branched-chain amino acid transport system substrate-binding protein